MTKADLYVERGANFLEELSRKVAAEGGFAAKLSEPLAEDAVFLRKLKPTLVLARIKGEPPSDGQAESVRVAPAPAPAPEPQPKKKQKKMKSNGGGPSPIVVIGAALIAGILIAKFVDWRGHAHPRL
jgi:hypothetical protein